MNMCERCYEMGEVLMWKHKEDNSEAIITAKKHAVSSHNVEVKVKLPRDRKSVV